MVLALTLASIFSKSASSLFISIIILIYLLLFLEGPWESVMEAIKNCHLCLHQRQGIESLSTHITISTNASSNGPESIEQRLNTIKDIQVMNRAASTLLGEGYKANTNAVIGTLSSPDSAFSSPRKSTDASSNFTMTNFYGPRIMIPNIFRPELLPEPAKKRKRSRASIVLPSISEAIPILPKPSEEKDKKVPS